MKEIRDINILAIESSCDETAAAVIHNGREVRSNVISSQIELHKLYGGVVPEIASRKHIEKINQVIEEALKRGKRDIGRYRCNRGNLRSGTCGGSPCRCGGGKSDCLRKKSSVGRGAPYRGAYFRQLY